MQVRIQVTINGEPRDIPGGLTLRGMLLHLGVDPQRVAVELNRAIVRQAAWDDTRIEEDAKIEIVEFVGGGNR